MRSVCYQPYSTLKQILLKLFLLKYVTLLTAKETSIIASYVCGHVRAHACTCVCVRVCVCVCEGGGGEERERERTVGYNEAAGKNPYNWRDG